MSPNGGIIGVMKVPKAVGEGIFKEPLVSSNPRGSRMSGPPVSMESADVAGGGQTNAGKQNRTDRAGDCHGFGRVRLRVYSGQLKIIHRSTKPNFQGLISSPGILHKWSERAPRHEFYVETF